MTMGIDHPGDGDQRLGIDDSGILHAEVGTDLANLVAVDQDVSARKRPQGRVHGYDAGVTDECSHGRLHTLLGAMSLGN